MSDHSGAFSARSTGRSLYPQRPCHRPTGSEPTHISGVPFTWYYLRDRIPMHFIGGVLGVDIADGTLVPNLSYGVLRT